MRIGILGGTFNPPHIGHVVLAKEAIRKLCLDKIFFIPTNISPHKDNDFIDSLARFDMVKLTASQDKKFEVLDIEIKRGGVSFTVDTVKQLKRMYPEDDFFLIVGSDLANNFSSWKDYCALKSLVDIVVAQRKVMPLKNKDSFTIIDIPQVDISSSKIRELVKKDISIQDMVEKPVEKYIKKHNLYKA